MLFQSGLELVELSLSDIHRDSSVFFVSSDFCFSFIYFFNHGFSLHFVSERFSA